MRFWCNNVSLSVSRCDISSVRRYKLSEFHNIVCVFESLISNLFLMFEIVGEFRQAQTRQYLLLCFTCQWLCGSISVITRALLRCCWLRIDRATWLDLGYSAILHQETRLLLQRRSSCPQFDDFRSSMWYALRQTLSCKWYRRNQTTCSFLSAATTSSVRKRSPRESVIWPPNFKTLEFVVFLYPRFCRERTSRKTTLQGLPSQRLTKTKEVNRLLYHRYGENVIKFRDIKSPRDYHRGLENMSCPTLASRICGLRKYFFRIRLVFFNLWFQTETLVSIKVLFMTKKNSSKGVFMSQINNRHL